MSRKFLIIAESKMIASIAPYVVGETIVELAVDDGTKLKLYTMPNGHPQYIEDSCLLEIVDTLEQEVEDNNLDFITDDQEDDEPIYEDDVSEEDGDDSLAGEENYE